MIHDKEIARHISEMVLECNDRLDDSLSLVQDRCGQEEVHAYRRAIGKVLGEIYLEIMTPIYQEHPDLTPPGLKVSRV
jgi:hypothetical protein